jgi:hypothetical protein
MKFSREDCAKNNGNGCIQQRNRLYGVCVSVCVCVFVEIASQTLNSYECVALVSYIYMCTCACMCAGGSHAAVATVRHYTYTLTRISFFFSLSLSPSFSVAYSSCRIFIFAVFFHALVGSIFFIVFSAPPHGGVLRKRLYVVVFDGRGG